jgi:transposase InsO family protein
MSQQLSAKYPTKRVCEALDCPRSTYYYEQIIDPQDVVDSEVIERVLMRWPFYGYRRMTAQFKREGYSIGETRVRRLLKQIEHSVKVGRVKVMTTDSKHDLPRYPNRIKGLKIERPNQVWQADITYIRLGRHFIYLAVILDSYTRSLRGWHLSRSLDKSLTISALKMALQRHPAPEIHHSDQGSQYATPLYTSVFPKDTTLISMSAVGQPTENGLAERFMRTLKEEHVDYSDYQDFDDAERLLAHWLEVEYMTERVHSALDYLTPVEFETLALNQSQSLLLSA